VKNALARIISSDMTAQLSSAPDTPMTEAGGLFGTVEYMAPEQIQGDSERNHYAHPERDPP